MDHLFSVSSEREDIGIGQINSVAHVFDFDGKIRFLVLDSLD